MMENSENSGNLDLFYSIPPWLRKSKVPLGPERFTNLDPNRSLQRRGTFKEMQFEDEEWHSLALVVETIKTYRRIQTLESDPLDMMDMEGRNSQDLVTPRIYTNGPLIGQEVISPSTMDITKDIEKRWAFEGQFEVKSVEELRQELEELRIQGQFENMEAEAEKQYLPSKSSLHDMTMRFDEARISNDLDFSTKSIESFMLKRKREQEEQKGSNKTRSLQFGFLWEVDSDGFPLYPEGEVESQNGGKFQTDEDFQNSLPQPQPLQVFQWSPQQTLFYPAATTTATTTTEPATTTATAATTTTVTTTTTTQVYTMMSHDEPEDSVQAQDRQNSNQNQPQNQVPYDVGYFSEIEDL